MNRKGRIAIEAMIFLALAIIVIFAGIMFAKLGKKPITSTQYHRYAKIACLQVMGNCTEDGVWENVKVNTSRGKEISLKEICTKHLGYVDTEEDKCLKEVCDCEEVKPPSSSGSQQSSQQQSSQQQPTSPADDGIIIKQEMSSQDTPIVKNYFEDYRRKIVNKYNLPAATPYSWKTDKKNVKDIIETIDDLCEKSKNNRNKIHTKTIKQVYSDEIKVLKSSVVTEMPVSITIKSNQGKFKAESGKCKQIRGGNLKGIIAGGGTYPDVGDTGIQFVNYPKILDKYYVALKIRAKNGNVGFELIFKENADKKEREKIGQDAVNDIKKEKKKLDTKKDLKNVKNYMEVFQLKSSGGEYLYKICKDRGFSYVECFELIGLDEEAKYIKALEELREKFKNNDYCNMPDKTMLTKMEKNKDIKFDGKSFSEVCDHFNMSKAMCLEFLGCDMKKVKNWKWLRGVCAKSLKEGKFRRDYQIDLSKYFGEYYSGKITIKSDDICNYFNLKDTWTGDYCYGYCCPGGFSGSGNKCEKGGSTLEKICNKVKNKIANNKKINLDSITVNGESALKLCYKAHMNEPECLQYCAYTFDIEELKDVHIKLEKLARVCKILKKNNCNSPAFDWSTLTKTFDLTKNMKDIKIINACDNFGLDGKPCLNYCGCEVS